MRADCVAKLILSRVIMLFRRSLRNELSNQQEVRDAPLVPSISSEERARRRPRLCCVDTGDINTMESHQSQSCLGTLQQRKGFSLLLLHAVRKAQTTHQRFCVSNHWKRFLKRVSFVRHMCGPHPVTVAALAASMG